MYYQLHSPPLGFWRNNAVRFNRFPLEGIAVTFRIVEIYANRIMWFPDPLARWRHWKHWGDVFVARVFVFGIHINDSPRPMVHAFAQHIIRIFNRLGLHVEIPIARARHNFDFKFLASFDSFLHTVS